MGAPVLLNLVLALQAKGIKCKAWRAFYRLNATSSINSIVQEHEC